MSSIMSRLEMRLWKKRGDFIAAEMASRGKKGSSMARSRMTSTDVKWGNISSTIVKFRATGSTAILVDSQENRKTR